MGKRLTRLRGSFIWSFLAFVTLAGGSYADDSAFRKPAPAGPADLQLMERHVTSIVKDVMPSTVALQVGMAHGSGVVISEDGYVLTAAHVIERPGRSVRIVFPNGRTARGRTLGVNPHVDGGLVQITDPGPWPFTPMAPADDGPRPGDWCLALGHPGGFEPGRTPPVRLGRVIDIDHDILRTDCTITMGDSGGPLFDMKGRVIGVHSRIADETTMNLHVPAATYHESWEQLVTGEASRQPSRFLTRLDTNGDGQITRSEVPESYRTIFDRMASKLDLDPDKAYSVEELSRSLGLDSAREFDARLLLPVRFTQSRDSLGPERFAHGRAVRSAFRDLIGDTRTSIVRVKCDGEDVALGTIVTADGWIVTKASELTDDRRIVCSMANRREMPARIIYQDPNYDLAVLEVQADGLNAVQFDAPDVHAGMWLASPGQAERPVAIGIVSNGQRAIARQPGVLGIRIDNVEGGGAVVVAVMPGSGAASAGLKAGDRVTQVASTPIKNMAHLQAEVRKHRIGDRLATLVVRDGRQFEFSVRLSAAEDVFVDPQPVESRRPSSSGPSWRGPLSHRRDDFPAAIQHDTVLRPQDCGGPVVDAGGRVIGVNIARADRTASYALPGSTVLAVLDRIKSTQPPRPKPAPADAAH